MGGPGLEENSLAIVVFEVSRNILWDLAFRMGGGFTSLALSEVLQIDHGTTLKYQQHNIRPPPQTHHINFTSSEVEQTIAFHFLAFTTVCYIVSEGEVV